MASSEVFLDTNGLVALLNRTDSLHAAAETIWQHLLESRRSFVLTDWVFAEVGNGMARTNGRQETAAFLGGLAASALCEVVFVTDGLLDASLVRYRERSDKQWGLVDCASMIVMEQRSVRDVFTNDHHFHQAGFNCLLREAG